LLLDQRLCKNKVLIFKVLKKHLEGNSKVMNYDQ
jgi:hypothetical protein